MSARIRNCTFALCERVNPIVTCPDALSDGELRYWLLPLFGHTIYCPPDAEESLCTAKGEKLLWPDKLSSSTSILVLPALLVVVVVVLVLVLVVVVVVVVVVPPPDEIVPAEAVKVTMSSFAPSSRLKICNVCEPGDRLLNVAGVNVPHPLVDELFCVLHDPESIL